MTLSRLNNIIYLAVLFLPIALVTGPFISDLIISLAGITLLINCYKDNEKKYFLNKLSIIFFSWCFYLILISFFSEDIYISLKSSLFYFRGGLFALMIWYLIDNYKEFIKHFTYALLATFIFLIFDGYIQYFIGQNIFGSTYGGAKLSSLFGEEEKMGQFLARLLPLLFGLFSFSFVKSRYPIFIAMVILIATDVLIFLSGERTAFLLLFISTALIILLINKWKFIRLITFAFSIGLITLIAFTSSNVKERMIDKTISELDAGGNEIYAFTAIHQAHYETAFKIFMNNPLFGAGPNTFRILCNEDKYYVQYGCSTHPHNTYLQLLAEVGIIGIAPIILILLIISYRLFKQGLFILKLNSNSITDFQVCLYVSVFVSLWPIAPSFNFFNNWINIIYFLPIGFLMYSYYSK